MHYKISYNKHFNNEDGSVYNQTINLFLTRQEFRELNYYLATYKLNNPNNWYVQRYVDTLKKGVNYTTITLNCIILQYYLNIFNDKRYINNRNTIYKINIIK